MTGRSPTSAELTLQSFAPLVGEMFRVDLAVAGTLELELSEAGEGDAGPGSERDPFRLLFRGPGEPVLAQRTHRLEHPVLGALEIFLVPVGRDARGTSYEAIFA